MTTKRTMAVLMTMKCTMTTVPTAMTIITPDWTASAI